MWEEDQGIKPWIAARVIAFSWEIGRADMEILERNRVAPGMSIIRPKAADTVAPGASDIELSHFKGDPVRWVTSMNAETIILTRYKVIEPGKPWKQNGSPARVWKVSRTEWLNQTKPVTTGVPAT
jgi:hypothetical protein